MSDAPLSPHAVELADAVHALVTRDGKQHFWDRYVQWHGEHKASRERAEKFDRKRRAHFLKVCNDPKWRDKDHPPDEGLLWDDETLEVETEIEWYDAANKRISTYWFHVDPNVASVIDHEEVKRTEEWNHWHARIIARKAVFAAYVPLEFYRDRRPYDNLPLPPPHDREVTLLEKYAALIAVHDTVYCDCPICSEPPTEDGVSSDQDFEQLLGQLAIAVLRARVRNLSEEDWQRVRRWLPDIEADLSSPDDLLTMDELAQLVVVERKTLQNKLAEARRNDFQGKRPPEPDGKGRYRYQIIRPWLVTAWPNREHRFPESFADAMRILAADR